MGNCLQVGCSVRSWLLDSWMLASNCPFLASGIFEGDNVLIKICKITFVFFPDSWTGSPGSLHSFPNTHLGRFRTLSLQWSSLAVFFWPSSCFAAIFGVAGANASAAAAGTAGGSGGTGVAAGTGGGVGSFGAKKAFCWLSSHKSNSSSVGSCFFAFFQLDEALSLSDHLPFQSCQLSFFQSSLFQFSFFQSYFSNLLFSNQSFSNWIGHLHNHHSRHTATHATEHGQGHAWHGRPSHEAANSTWQQLQKQQPKVKRTSLRIRLPVSISTRQVSKQIFASLTPHLYLFFSYSYSAIRFFNAL